MSEKGKDKLAVFTKQQFLKAASFTHVQRDVLRVLLKDDETYTLDQVNKILTEYAKRKVT